MTTVESSNSISKKLPRLHHLPGLMKQLRQNEELELGLEKQDHPRQEKDFSVTRLYRGSKDRRRWRRRRWGYSKKRLVVLHFLLEGERKTYLNWQVKHPLMMTTSPSHQHLPFQPPLFHLVPLHHHLRPDHHHSPLSYHPLSCFHHLYYLHCHLFHQIPDSHLLLLHFLLHFPLHYLSHLHWLHHLHLHRQELVWKLDLRSRHFPQNSNQRDLEEEHPYLQHEQGEGLMMMMRGVHQHKPSFVKGHLCPSKLGKTEERMEEPLLAHLLQDYQEVQIKENLYQQRVIQKQGVEIHQLPISEKGSNHLSGEQIARRTYSNGPKENPHHCQ
mmetsp:Transcript_13531/g.18552  ORF Transcript_13531/g.18552 Transcript_13531/m.18552 type:complete len:328 (+) Transcript_13531:1903-2886(+)